MLAQSTPSCVLLEGSEGHAEIDPRPKRPELHEDREARDTGRVRRVELRRALPVFHIIRMPGISHSQ